ncbi:MAG: hypothetical protein ABFQ65_00920 [Nanoarchaeota archaeon]
MEITDIGYFTKNKQKVREMNLILIKRFNLDKKEKLKYFGLPSEEMKDISLWKEYLSNVSAVERGIKGQEHIKQHNLLLRSFLLGISDKIKLYRGEMDDILMRGKDSYGQKVDYPYHLINLDYTGGVFYKEERDKSKRIDSIKSLFRNQAKFRQDFLFFITCNMDNNINEEHSNFMQKALKKLNDSEKEKLFMENYGNPDKKTQLKVLTISLIQDLAKEFFECETYTPIFYEGNNETKMVNFSFRLKYVDKYVTEKKVKLNDEEIIKFPVYICKEGLLEKKDLPINL